MTTTKKASNNKKPVVVQPKAPVAVAAPVEAPVAAPVEVAPEVPEGWTAFRDAAIRDAAAHLGDVRVLGCFAVDTPPGRPVGVVVLGHKVEPAVFHTPDVTLYLAVTGEPLPVVGPLVTLG